MKNLTIALMVAAAFTTVGCKKKGGAGEAMAKMSEFKDKMCACKDKKCADDVQDQMNKWSAENAKNAGDKQEKPDEKTMKEMQDVGTKYGECMAKAMGGGDAATPPATGSGSAAPAADAPKVGEGPVVPAMTLAKLDLPPLKVAGIPESASWSAAYAEKDGDRLANFVDGDKGFASVKFVDCNLPKLKEFISKSVDERGELEYCFHAPAADAPKIKTYPRIDLKDDKGVTILVGHVVVTTGISEQGKDKVKADDLAKWLESVDFSSIEK